MLPFIGITQGDPAGIGAEIAVKALSHRDIVSKCNPVIIGDRAVIQDAVDFTHSPLKIHRISDVSEAVMEYGTINLMDQKLLNPGDWEYKQISAIAGNAAFHYIKKAIDLALSNEIQAVVTGPISKESLNLAGYHYAGHTEIFAHFTHSENVAMLLTGPGLRVIHVSTHVSMRRACELVTKERVYSVIRHAVKACRMLGIDRPRIGVAGLNAHCSENGLFGSEEADAIIPAIYKAQSEGICVAGPVPPDTIFVKAMADDFDIVVAMYHDQGHIPLKLCGFKKNPDTGQFTQLNGVNATIGLPIIRTSVDHGTAFDKAGDGCANEQSMVEAIQMAAFMAGRMYGKAL